MLHWASGNPPFKCRLKGVAVILHYLHRGAYMNLDSPESTNLTQHLLRTPYCVLTRRYMYSESLGSMGLVHCLSSEGLPAATAFQRCPSRIEPSVGEGSVHVPTVSRGVSAQ